MSAYRRYIMRTSTGPIAIRIYSIYISLLLDITNVSCSIS